MKCKKIKNKKNQSYIHANINYLIYFGYKIEKILKNLLKKKINKNTNNYNNNKTLPNLLLTMKYYY